MYSLDIIIPLVNLVEKSLRSRIDTINYAIKNFYSKQTNLDLTMIFVEQSLDGKIYYLENIEMPYGYKAKFIEVKYEKFNKPWVFNCGFKAGEADYIIFADSDIMAYQDYISSSIDWLEENSFKWAFAWNKLYYSDYLEKRRVVYHGEKKLQMTDSTLFKPSRGVNEGGYVLYKRGFYEAIGMGNEFIEELGGPDNEQARRAHHVSGTYKSYKQLIYHLEHEQTFKSARPSRRQNIIIYRTLIKDMDKMVKILRRLGGGNDKPYCADTSFEKEFGTLVQL